MAYERGCEDRMPSPLFTPDRSAFSACGFWFESRNGAFRGPAPTEVYTPSPEPTTLRAILAALDSHHIAPGPVPGMPCDPHQDDCSFPIALGPDGDRLAFADARAVHIVELRDGALLPLHDQPLALGDGGIAFLDRKTVFAWSNNGVHAIREGAVDRSRAWLANVPVPRGFRAGQFREEGGVREVSVLGFDSETELAHLGLVARFRKDQSDVTIRTKSKHGKLATRAHHLSQVDAWFYAGDPTEFDQTDIDDFSTAVRQRYAGGAKVLRAWDDHGSRSVELVEFRREGCEYSDRYSRVFERDGILYRVVLSVDPGTSTGDIPFEAVFDAPFKGEGAGASGPKRIAVVPPPWPHGPC
jgi:hypothetical protein